MTEAVSWDLAERVAARVAGRVPLAESYHYASLQPDFEELTAKAEGLVAEATGLRSLAGPARARVTDRAGWVSANVASFQRLLRPITDKVGSRLAASPVAPISRAVAGAQMGTILGWMSTRVLGQYDLLLVEDDRPEDQDIVYYVGPNILHLERQFAFPPREFRLWLALHEVTHRAQFTGVPWMRGHFVSLVERGLGALDPDPRQFLEGLKRAVDELMAGQNPFTEGILGLIAGPEQKEVLDRVQGLMSLLEGHGDVTMDRAGAAAIPSAGRFSRVLRDRRRSVRGPARLLQQVIGLEAKLRQYEEGEEFIAVVERAGGTALLDRVWRGPDWLPSLAEIRDPEHWLARVGPLDPAAA
ncbi:MAG: zinc-dependent metalloprotease [Acidimicrobiales bacterium]